MNRLLVSMGRFLAVVNKDLAVKEDLGGTGGSGGSSAGATDTDTSKITSIADFASTLKLLLNRILGPVLAIIGVFAVVYAVYLGVQYAKAEDAQKRKEIQGRMIGAIIGAAILVVAATICLAVNWSDVYYSFQDPHSMSDKNLDNFCDYCGHGSSHKFHSGVDK